MEHCFTDCVHTFRSQALGDKEETCVQRCFSKYSAGTQRIATRFQELNAQSQGPDKA